MARIQLLDSQTIDQIAAGEVIENPASVIKELCENALDAKATKLNVVTEGGGEKKIIVSDDGEGIAALDLPLSVQRHATSKLISIEDIFQLRSLGFRGEALASIGSVAHLKIQSHDGQSSPHQIEVRGSKVSEIKKTTHHLGTTVSVEELFYNVSARKAFQKTRGTQRAQIKKILLDISLMFSKVSIKWIDDGMVRIELPKQSFEKRVQHLFGKDIFSDLVFVDHTFDLGRIQGYMSRPKCVKAHRKGQIFIVNDRRIFSNLLSSLLTQSYGHLIGLNQYPLCCLKFQIAPRYLDVNVHPQKKEIRFLEHEALEKVFLHLIKSAFKIPSFKPFKTFSFSSPTFPERQPKPKFLQTTVFPKSKVSLALLKLIGDFALATLVNEIYLIDLKGIKKTLCYERLNSSEIKSQKLLFPLHLELSNEEIDTLESLNLSSLGFEWRILGKTTCTIDALPQHCSENEAKNFILQIRKSRKSSLETLRLRLCKNVGNTSFSHQEVQFLLDQIEHLNLTSPFGANLIICLDKEKCKKILLI